MTEKQIRGLDHVALIALRNQADSEVHRRVEMAREAERVAKATLDALRENGVSTGASGAAAAVDALDAPAERDSRAKCASAISQAAALGVAPATPADPSEEP